MTDDILADQIDYYRRRAGEYDVTAYHDLPVAHERIARLVTEMRPAGRVLEIACGTGMWTDALAVSAETVTAIDAAAEAVAIARQRVRSANVNPAELERRLRRLGWDGSVRRDGDDWVRGEVRPGSIPAVRAGTGDPDGDGINRRVPPGDIE
jgi:SAM-dependent methyltransferase